MTKNILVWLLVIFFVVNISVAQAQQPKKIPRIGLLSGAADPAKPVLWEPFFEALRQLGYLEGQTIILERRFANGQTERVPELAADLARLKIDLIVVTGTTETRAAKQATATIPIIMVTAPDPIESGLVASLSRPGGNVTGLSMLAPELTGKRIEILKETVQAGHIALLTWAADTTGESVRQEAENAAKALKVKLTAVAVRDADGLGDAFSMMKRKQLQGIVVPLRLLFVNQRARIVELAGKNRLPAIYESAAFVEAGGLMSYGPLLSDLYRRAAVYVDKILKGRTPADLPVEQPIKFEFIVNLKAAKAIGLTIRPNVLARADRVIR
jgi:putative ABC transport system substrate-binding protein